MDGRRPALSRLSRAAAFALALIVVSATAYWAFHPSQRTSRKPPSPSPDRLPDDLAGRELAFALKDGVYVSRADGSGLRRVTDIAGFEYQPDWTSDGTKLALRVDDESGRVGGVWSVNADGSGAVDLATKARIAGGSPDWSPDGRRIAFVGKGDGDKHFGIYVMDAGGRGARRITDRRVEAQYPDWSPDGKRIAFSLVRGGSFDIYVMDADGSNIRQLSNEPGEDNWPEWSPDGAHIAYSRDEGPAGDGLWIMDANGSNEHRLVVSGGEPSWSPDGMWIAFDCAPSSDGDGGMCAIHPDGSGRTPIVGDHGSFPAWRP